MLYAISGPFVAVLLAIACLFVLGVSIATLSSSEDVYQTVGGTILLLVSLLLFLGAVYGSYHRVIPPNSTGIVVDLSTGRVSGDVAQPGIIYKGWTQRLFIYPGRTNYQWCPQVTPSVRGGAGINMTVCITSDASKINWKDQYYAYNGDEGVIQIGWLKDSVQSSIAYAVASYDPQDLTNRRAIVENSIKEELTRWAARNKIPLVAVSILNWDFTSAEMSKSYEAAQVSIAKINAAENELEAAKIQAKTATLRANSCVNAGFITEQYCIQFLQLEWLQNLPKLPDNFIISLGGQASPAVSIPQSSPSAPESRK